MSLQDGGSQQISRQDSRPLGYGAVSKGEWFLMVRRKVMLSSSLVKQLHTRGTEFSTTPSCRPLISDFPSSIGPRSRQSLQDLTPNHVNPVRILTPCYAQSNFFITLQSEPAYRIIVLPFILYKCEIWSLTSREEHRLRVFENRVLRRKFGPMRVEVIRQWRRLRHLEFYFL